MNNLSSYASLKLTLSMTRCVHYIAVNDVIALMQMYFIILQSFHKSKKLTEKLFKQLLIKLYNWKFDTITRVRL